MVSAILGGLKIFGGKLIASLVTEKMLAWLAFYFLERLAKETDNTIDDEVIAEVKKHYYG